MVHIWAGALAHTCHIYESYDIYDTYMDHIGTYMSHIWTHIWLIYVQCICPIYDTYIYASYMIFFPRDVPRCVETQKMQLEGDTDRPHPPRPGPGLFWAFPECFEAPLWPSRAPAQKSLNCACKGPRRAAYCGEPDLCRCSSSVRKSRKTFSKNATFWKIAQNLKHFKSLFRKPVYQSKAHSLLRTLQQTAPRQRLWLRRYAGFCENVHFDLWPLAAPPFFIREVKRLQKCTPLKEYYQPCNP